MKYLTHAHIISYSSPHSTAGEKSFKYTSEERLYILNINIYSKMQTLSQTHPFIPLAEIYYTITIMQVMDILQQSWGDAKSRAQNAFSRAWYSQIVQGLSSAIGQKKRTPASANKMVSRLLIIQ